MELNLKDEQLKELVAGAIVTSLTGEVREKLVKDAVVELLAKRKDPYDRSQPAKSELQTAFENAVFFLAREVVREYMNKDESIRAKILEALTKAMTKVFSENQDKLVDSLAHSISNVIRFDDGNER